MCNFDSEDQLHTHLCHCAALNGTFQRLFSLSHLHQHSKTPMGSRAASLSDSEEEDLQPIKLSSYIRKALRLDNERREGVLHEQFEQFVLEGRNGLGHHHKLDITDMKTRLDVGDTSISLHRDYDSIIGFYAGLPLFESLEFGLVPRPMDVLPTSSKLHVKLPEELFCIVSPGATSECCWMSLIIHFHLELCT